MAPFEALVSNVRLGPFPEGPMSPVREIDEPVIVVVVTTNSIPAPPPVPPVKLTFPLCVMLPLSFRSFAVAVRFPVPVVEVESP